MKDITFRYTVHLLLNRGRMDPIGWPTRPRAGMYLPLSLRGTPNAAKLAQYVRDYNASLQPGGCNEHLGIESRATAAAIYDHSTTPKTQVATYTE